MSEEVVVKENEQTGIKETAGNMFSGIKDVFGNMKQSLQAETTVMKDESSLFFERTGGGLLSYFKAINDNVIIPSDTKTVIGEDFVSLYRNSKTREMVDDDNNIINVIKPDCDYETDMHMMSLSFSIPRMYDELPVESKMAYEMVLLSKKYASQYTGNSEKDEALAKEYAGYMSRYAAYCEENGISFNDVLGHASNELQTETRDYLQEDKQIVSDDSWTTTDNYRVVTNRAHNWLVTCGKQTGYVDKLPPSLEDDITLEQTQDDIPRYAKNSSAFIINASAFLSRIGLWFKEKFESIRQAMSDVKNLASDMTVGVAEGVADRYDSEVISDRQNGIDNGPTFGEVFNAISDGMTRSLPEEEKKMTQEEQLDEACSELGVAVPADDELGSELDI